MHPNRKRRPVMDRFIDKFIPEPMSGCWLWTGAISTDSRYRSNDRPVFHEGTRKSKRLRRASHVSWELHNGMIPKGLCVLHSCDNPMCVNPDHLFLGTRVDNVADMDAKGRRGSHTGRFGIDNSQAKLTDADVSAIRKSSNSGRDLARHYSVSPAAVSMIRHNKRWSIPT